jgi:hypothetical protein
MDKIMNPHDSARPRIAEGLEYGDLRRLVRPLIQVDGFKSKMGDDDSIVVLAFPVREKKPANDLMEFFEKSYDPVLDADVSEGEDGRGDTMVFVELSRDPDLPATLMDIVGDLNSLTGTRLDDWRFTYRRDPTVRQLTAENIQEVVPLTPREYRARFEKKPPRTKSTDINDIKTAAGIDVPAPDVKDSELQSLQRAAGIG